ncbi:multidrug MFS transporter [Pediococcus acidilactici]|uniref:DHA2 family efflux MFS transporter permease subunit n=1 Tax=Pediococcus acidilactici TaxID=1254 RepID=UPI00071AF1BC|nr:DHA2 family efflux MFS transporter permease subunit [Pediococcus acidilactici]KSV57145.1 multidrug MFS transporter [Pediococcus acidilactici]
MNKKQNASWILAALLICAFTGMFSETSLNIALTVLMTSLKVNAGTIQWLTTGYLLTLGIVMPFTALLIQMVTTRKLFFTATTNLAVGTLLGGISFNFPMLLFARILQAIGMGILLPLMFNTVLIIFDKNKRGSAMGTLGLVLSFAPALGPAISGVLIQTTSWRFIFFVLLPFIILGMLIGYNKLSDIGKTQKQHFDIFSAITSTIGFGMVVYSFNMAENSWTNPLTLVSLAIGLISLLFFVKRQNHTKTPILNLTVFKYPVFLMGLSLVLICSIVFQGTMIILPMYLQTGARLSVLSAGLILLPGSATNGFLQMVAGHIFDNYGYKRLVFPGFLIVIMSLLFFKMLTPNSSVLLIVLLDIVLMAGIAMIWTGAQTHALNQLPPSLYADGSAIINTLLQVVGAISVATSITILTNGKNTYLSSLKGIVTPTDVSKAITLGANHVFAGLLVVSFLGLIISFSMHRISLRINNTTAL